MTVRRLSTLLVALVAALAISGSAIAFDCIRVSSSLKGLQQSTRSGNWLLFNFGSAEGAQQTFANVFDVDIDDDTAQCFASAYAESGQPKYFALGVGVAGGKKQSVTPHGRRTASEGWGVIAWNNKNEWVLGNGKGIDHIDDSAILPAVIAAGEQCGISIPEED